MPTIHNTTLTATGKRSQAVFVLTIDAELATDETWNEFELRMRFMGADAGLRGNDDRREDTGFDLSAGADTPLRQAGPGWALQHSGMEGRTSTFTVTLENLGGRRERWANEDRPGRDEIYADISIIEIASRIRKAQARSNKVQGRF